MTTSLDLHRLTAALRRSAVRATLAPSVHNTQPWHFQLRPNELSMTADASRQLRILDPTGRQMTISCGCALFNARASLAASGVAVNVERFPDPGRVELVARLVAADVPDGSVDPIAALDNVVELRRTNRRRFADDDVPVELVESLQRAASAEDSELVEIRREEDRLAVAILSQRADAIQNVSAAYRAELRAWTSTELERFDGVPTWAIPHVDGGARDEVPIRDFDTSGLGALPIETRSSRNQCLLLLGTRGDNPLAWLRAGEALERIQLEVTRQGFAVSPMTQVIEVVSTRAELRHQLRLAMAPQVLLRVGRAANTPATRRRRLVDVLSESSPDSGLGSVHGRGPEFVARFPGRSET
jgi:nitroreductase